MNGLAYNDPRVWEYDTSVLIADSETMGRVM